MFKKIAVWSVVIGIIAVLFIVCVAQRQIITELRASRLEAEQVLSILMTKQHHTLIAGDIIISGEHKYLVLSVREENGIIRFKKSDWPAGENSFLEAYAYRFLQLPNITKVRIGEAGYAELRSEFQD